MKTKWQVRAKSMLRNSRGEEVGYSRNRIVAEFYISSDAERYAEQCRRERNWVCTVTFYSKDDSNS